MARPPKDPIEFGHLRQQKGWWHFRWTHPETGEQHSVALGTKDKRRAGQVVSGRRVRGKMISGLAEQIELNNYLPVDRETKRENRALTFASFAEQFAKHKEDTEDWVATAAYANRSVRRILCKEFGSRPLNSVSKRDVEEYIARRLGEEGCARSTVNKALVFLKGMYPLAVERGHCRHNPVSEIKIVQPEGNPPEPLSAEELDSLLEHLEGLDHGIALVAADTGMRRSEMQRLTWAKVSFDDKVITVMGRTKKGEAAKGKRFRLIPMTDRACACLQSMQQHAQEQWHQREDGTPIDDLPVFPSKTDPTRPFSGINEALAKAGVAAGIGHVHPHQLRDSFATHLRKKGANLMDLQDLGGWKTSAMVKRYAAADPELHRDAIERLGR